MDDRVCRITLALTTLVVGTTGCYAESHDDLAMEQDVSAGDTSLTTTDGGTSEGSTGAAGTESGDDAGDAGSSTGSAGPDAACSYDAECDDTNACTIDVCENYACSSLPLDGVEAIEQTVGDCRLLMCVGGEAAPDPDPADLPDDDNPCTVDACDGGTIAHTPAAIGLPCLDDGLCDGDGACVECTSPDECDHLPVDDECQMRTCLGGVCGQVFAPLGALPSETLQSSGDCLRVVCDGSGGTVAQPHNSDPPIDGLECTEDECSAGEPENPPLPPGTPCAAGECNDEGDCVGCNTADDCGEPTACQAPICGVEGICGVANTSAGMPLGANAQTDGDCQELRCDGNGAIGSYADDGDLPPSDGNDCTEEVCSNGMVQSVDEPLATPCNGGASQCDGGGDCVQCIDADDCSPSTNACEIAVCSANQCGIEDAPDGTVCDDVLFCTTGDSCTDGACGGTPVECELPLMCTELCEGCC